MHLQSSNFETIMANFTPVCQRYTDVMAHKYYLQHLLFNGTNNATATVLMNLTSVIIKLQVMANSLQTVQVCMCILIHTSTHYKMCILQMENDGDTCVKFTPSQYRRIYYSRLQYPVKTNSTHLDAICLLQMRTLSWQVII